VAVFVNKLSIAPDLKGHSGFPKFLVEYKKALKDADTSKQDDLLAKFYQLVTQTEHRKNVEQAKLPLELANVVEGYIVVLIELPFTHGDYDLSKLPASVVPIIINQNNMHTFFGQSFTDKFIALLEQTMRNYKASIHAAAV
jgi:hypothetical protein